MGRQHLLHYASDDRLSGSSAHSWCEHFEHVAKGTPADGKIDELSEYGGSRAMQSVLAKLPEDVDTFTSTMPALSSLEAG